MTCPTDKVRDALRKLKEDRFSGKISPAIIRQMTGIKSPGKILGEFKDKGYLIHAGSIRLPAARGTTVANLYTINPKSDFTPKERFNVGLHNRKNAANSKTSDIRKAIKAYGGQVFSTSQIRNDVGNYTHTFQRLLQLEELGEITHLEIVKTGGRSTMTWKEIKVNDDLIYKEPVLSDDAKQSNNPWASIWPEFFVVPKILGTLRSYAVTDF